jgi:hypothetical protein
MTNTLCFRKRTTIEQHLRRGLRSGDVCYWLEAEDKTDLNGCDFNRSMQHLISKHRGEDVADEEISTKDLLHRSR